MINRVMARFHDIVGHEPRGVWSAPGILTLIGDQTDYNAGLVLPMAIDRSTVVAVGLRDDGLVRVATSERDDIVTVELTRCTPGSVSGWAANPLGVLWALGGARAGAPGLDLVIDSDIPVNAGFAEATALASAVALAVNDVWELDLDRLDLAAAVQRSESEMSRTTPNIVGSLVAQLAEIDSAVLIDCETLDHSQCAISLDDAGLTILAVTVPSRRASSMGQLLDRQSDCLRAAHDLGADSLREFVVDDLPRIRDKVDDKTFGRVRHVVTENARVAAAVDALGLGETTTFGDFLVASHLSLRNDFGLVDSIGECAVGAARESGALGARQTSDGTTIVLAAHRDADAISEAIRQEFANNRFIDPEIIAITPARGAHRVF